MRFTIVGRRRALFVAALLLPMAPVLAALSSSDMLNQLRATPKPTMGALEVGGTGPAAPTGLSITIQRVTT